MNAKDWKRVATDAAGCSFGYTNFLGFAGDFCQAGGGMFERFRVPLGSSDFGGVIAALPDDVDAIHLGVGGTDANNFLNHYEQAGAETNLIGGTIMADQTVLTSRGRAREALIGTPTSGPLAEDKPITPGRPMRRPVGTPARKASASPRRRSSGRAATPPRWLRPTP